MQEPKVALDLLVETSWEVCNKVGGIYTVLSTKAKTLRKLYGDNVIFIGPDHWGRGDGQESPVFTPVASLLRGWLKGLVLPEGVTVRAGRWEVPGRPIALLVKFDSLYASKDAFYGRMWELYGVDSLHAYGDYDEGCAFARAAAIVIKSLTDWHLAQGGGKRIVAHFDEWTTAMGLLEVKATCPQVATVFTTHATCIGRSICGNSKPLYDYLKGYNGDQMARELNMEAKHSLEKAAAHQAGCFTTVSEVTARECEQLLEIRPGVVTPNGFEGDFVPGPRKRAKVRAEARERLLKVASDLCDTKFADDTFIIATSGRCEWHNKGIDIFIDAMDGLDIGNALAFVLVPGCSTTARAERRGLTWTVFLPWYLDGNDPMLKLDYYDTLPGIDATVFPSYYEPWGYTPLESVAFSVPTVTTSLAGFGQWVLQERKTSFEGSGVNVVHRSDSNHAEVVAEVRESLRFVASRGEHERETISKAAYATAAQAAWSYFIAYYVETYEKALAAVGN